MPENASNAIEIDQRPPGLLPPFVCPGCKAVLREHDSRLQCPNCGKFWPVCNGVPHFVEDYPYRGDIPRSAMTEVLARAAQGSWREALTGSRHESVRRAAGAISNLGSANWYRLTDLPPGSRVLDAGAGLGTVAHALAQRFSAVVALEPVAEAVEFMRHRFLQDGLGNISCVQSSVWDIPFPSQSFDLVVLSGILEGIANGKEGHPLRLQESVLKRAFDLLRPGGYIYLAAENRVSWQSLLGKPDTNCGLPYAALLPHPLGRYYAKARGKAGAGPSYSHTAGKYAGMLRHAGFAAPQCFAAIPSYTAARLYVPLTNNIFSYYSANFDPVRSGIAAQVAHWLSGKLGASKYLENSFVLLARKERYGTAIL